MDINNISISGRLTKDPDMSQTTQGTICKFSIANNRGWKGHEKVTFVQIVTFGKMAEAVSKYCQKGSLVEVAGELNIKKYEDKYYTSILAREVNFKSSPQEKNNNYNKHDESDDLAF